MMPSEFAAMALVRDRREWWRASTIGAMLVAATTGKVPTHLTFSPFMREEAPPPEDWRQQEQALVSWAARRNKARKVGGRGRTG